MARTDTIRHFLADVASAIKAKKGSNASIPASLFDVEIANLEDISEYMDVTKISWYTKITHLLVSIPQMNFSRVMGMSYCFNDCTSLTTLPQMDLGNVEDMDFCFYNCRSLTTIPKLDFSCVTNMFSCFYGCKKLANIGGFVDIGKKYIERSPNYYKYDLDLSYTIATHDSLMNVINNLYNLNLVYSGTLYPQSLKLGSTLKAKLTPAEIAIATAKGWNVT